MSDKKCGACRWFNGDGWLNDNGIGMGECTYDPPMWIGPSPECIDEDTWSHYLFGYGWQRPMVGVGEDACHRFERPYEKRWWELKEGGAHEGEAR